jgi:hypothetical protein
MNRLKKVIQNSKQLNRMFNKRTSKIVNKENIEQDQDSTEIVDQIQIEGVSNESGVNTFMPVTPIESLVNNEYYMKHKDKYIRY